MKKTKVIKRAFAWLIVILVAYVVIYSYMNPDELVYRVDASHVPYYEGEFKDVPLDPLVKETNPFVYYALKYQWYFMLIALCFWLIDLNGTRNFLAKVKKFIKDNSQ